MREINGIVYADEPIVNITVKTVKPLENMMLLITFSTGEKKLFDCTTLTGKAFAPLKEQAVFSNPQIAFGTVTWANDEIDIAPEYLYGHSYAYNTEDILYA